MAAAFPLGAYDVHAVIGRGGIGHVWRAEHRAHALPVALKVLTHQTFSHREARQQIEREIRAAVLLDHPAIVQVFDTGRVPFGISQLPPGSPWIAMELVDGHALLDYRKRLTWRGLRHVLLHLLDALAHAHAMGVVHRDVKPGNVLVNGDFSQIKLADFGLAQRLEGVADGRISVAGTPAYMAPEQVQARWRDFGPSTDLYAVACLAYAMTTGQPVFPASGLQLLDAHVQQMPKPLSRPDAPAGFDAWLLRLLAKHPTARFVRAADAIEALLALGDPGSGPFIWGQAPPTPSAGGHVPSGPIGGCILPTESQRAGGPRPVPVSWRRPERRHPVARPKAVGLGVLRLRRLPLLGRVAERSTLWLALRRVAAQQAPHAVVLQGHAGFGKTHLAEWLGVRAHELGVAEVLRAQFATVAGPAHGLGAMLTRWLRCDGLPRAAVRDRLAPQMARWGLDDDLRALAALICPVDAEDPTGQVVFSSPNEEYELIRRLLQAASRTRSMVLLLDDVHAGPEALAWVRYLLAHHVSIPVLCVMTVQIEALARQPRTGEAIAALVERPQVTTLTLGPLGRRTRTQLLGEVLGLATPVAHRVDARAQGNPLFAVQLVRDWTQRKALTPTVDGFALRTDSSVDVLPANLHAVWSQRVQRLLAHHPDAQLALERAAVLGVDVHADEWEAVCADDPLAAPRPALELLLRAGLAQEKPDGSSWSFAHGMLRESLIEQARAAGRLATLHQRSAQVLSARAGRWQLERIGLHWLAGQAWDRAVPVLLEAAQARYGVGAYHRVGELLDAAVRGLVQCTTTQTPHWQVHALVLRGRLARAQGDMEPARQQIAQAVEAAQVHRVPWLAVLAGLEQTQLAFDAGQVDIARDRLAKCLAVARHLKRPELVARCHDWRAILALRRGELDAAAEFSEQAAAAFAQAGLPIGQARCDLMQARIAEQRGLTDRALAFNRMAQQRYGAAGVRSGLAECANHYGEVTRQTGQLDLAERAYKEALRIWSTIGSGYAPFARANLGLVQYARGRTVAARAALQIALAEFERADRRAAATEVHACLTACAAQMQDWSDFDAHLAVTCAHAERGQFAHGDVARLATDAGDLAWEADERSRAMAAWRLAQQWQALSNTGAAQAIGERLAAL